MGGNTDIPFIQLRANFELSSKEEALEVYELFKEEFKLFEPLYLSFQTASRINADFYGSIHMVTKTSKILMKEQWPLEELISFEDIADDSYFDWYKNGYEEFHTNYPELKTKVPLNSASSMKD